MRLIYKVISTLAVLMLLNAVLVGCSSDSNISEVNTESSDNGSYDLSVTLTNSSLSDKNTISLGDTANFSITVTNTSDNTGVSNQVVTYSLDIESTESSSTITNSNGSATISINTTSLLSGVVTLSVETAIDENTLSVDFPFLVVDNNVVSEDILLGYFDANNNFIEGEIYTDYITEPGTSGINAGATLGLRFSIVEGDNNDKVAEPINVTFTSSCVQNSKATISNNVTSVNGTVNATYKDVNCATADGNTDTITASVLLDNPPDPLIHNLNIAGEALGSIEFVSASPEKIVIKGTGGQGTQEASILTFRVKGELENPLPQIDVQFSLSTTAGGIELVDTEGVTDADGFVTAIVRSGTTPTPVRVNAIATHNGNTIETQSDLLTISTGLPDQDSMTLSLSTINPEAYDIIGTEVTVLAYLSDSFNNPVPDGTTVNFTAEAGQIGSSCNTINGSCSVTWRSTNPRVDDHRVTIFAYAVGHETFVDSNGNNTMDDNDGGVENTAITCPDTMTLTDCVNSVDAGFQIVNATLTTGFFDLSEAWRDDNENYVFDEGDELFDYNNNGIFESGDGKFNGPHCESDVICAEGASRLLHVRKSAILITSSSIANLSITNITDGGDVNGGESISIARGDAKTFTVYVSDTANQVMPASSSINITANAGSLTGDTQKTIANTVGTIVPTNNGGSTMAFTLRNNLAEAEDSAVAEVLISVATPSGRETTMRFNANLL